MKVNDIVTVHDGSYSQTLIKGKMGHTTGYSLRNHRFRVHGMDGEYPTDNEYTPTQWSGINNALLVDIDDPDFVLFTQERFCKVWKSVSRNVSSAPLTLAVPRGTKEILLNLKEL